MIALFVLLLLGMVSVAGRSVVEEIDGIPHVTRYQHDPQIPHHTRSNIGFSHFFKQKDSEIDLTATHEIVINVQYTAVDELRRIVRRISDPRSGEYGNYLGHATVNNIIENIPGKEIINDYLLTNNITILSSKNNGHRIRCSATLATWESISNQIL